jgi:hypothetical protein
MDAQEIIILIKKLPIQVVEHVTLKLVSQTGTYHVSGSFKLSKQFLL